MAGVNLTPEEVAERLHVSRGTLANWRVTGAGPRFIKWGRKVLYPISELEKFEKGNLRTSVHVKVNP